MAEAGGGGEKGVGGALTASLGKEDCMGLNRREESSIAYVYSDRHWGPTDLRSESQLFLATHGPDSEHLFLLY